MAEENNKNKRRPTSRISNLFFILGIILLATALDYNNRVTALIGTNLILIGAVLLYSRPVKFIRSDVLISALSNQSLTNSELVSYMGYKGEPKLYSPRSLWGLHNVVTIIPKDNLPKNNLDVNETNAVYISQDFIQIPPSGIGLLKLYEQEFKVNFTSLELLNFGNYLDEILINRLDLVKRIEVNINERVEVMLVKPISEAIINEVIENNRVKYGDPILNSIGCILAKITGKKITIYNIEYNKNRGEVLAIYNIED